MTWLSIKSKQSFESFERRNEVVLTSFRLGYCGLASWDHSACHFFPVIITKQKDSSYLWRFQIWDCPLSLCLFFLLKRMPNIRVSPFYWHMCKNLRCQDNLICLIGKEAMLCAACWKSRRRKRKRKHGKKVWITWEKLGWWHELDTGETGGQTSNSEQLEQGYTQESTNMPPTKVQCLLFYFFLVILTYVA